MAGDKETLLGMGFDRGRVEWALKATGNRGLQPAMDHILEHDGQPIPDLGAVAESASRGARGDAMDIDDDEDADALRSLGATANNAVEAKIKPLTEEEKKQKLAELREKMAQKRALKAIEDAKEQKATEALRRKAGKDMNQIKEELKVKQALQEAEQKKRDKIEDARAKAAIKAQIEADKKARNEKFAREKAIRDGLPIPGEASSATPRAPASVATPSSSGVAGKDYQETRLQIRISSGGPPYTTTLPSDASLREVAEFLAGQTLAVDVETVSFAQHFPRRVLPTHYNLS
ncbi:hypothetical protein H0H81_011983 [Sphagnurus paluster]|uniref:UBX domain-containing protein 1 n=1 Tax=Sphagnurus paluster TaxID=117069 RepID=A0A9P7KNJ6_9AGAR|nr:hypothetical protein H0H81_011983 [Sphagnurus paluster]